MMVSSNVDRLQITTIIFLTHQPQLLPLCGRLCLPHESDAVVSTYLHLSGFISVTAHGDIEMDLRRRGLTASFNEAEVQLAIEKFGAALQPGVV